MEQRYTNICSKATFVVLDVDYTAISLHDRIAQLADEQLECILGTTSDPNNFFKYRILMPLDRPVTPAEYRRLVKGISAFGLVTDLDRASEKPSQKFYAYAESTVLHNAGKSLIVDDYLTAECECLVHSLNCPLELHAILNELSSYSTAPPGKRTKYLLSAAFKLIEQGASDQLLEQAILHLNQSFLVPKDIDSVYRRVINFVKTKRSKP